MDAVTLPPGVTWLGDGRLGVAIVRGDLRPYALPPLPPVAPQAWAQHDKPCECIGKPRAYGDRITAKLCDHPDGRQVWRVRWLAPFDAYRDPDCGFYGPFPGNPRYENQLLSARATIQVVPVVAQDYFFGSGGLPDLPVVAIIDGAAFLMQSWVIDKWDQDMPLALDPLPTPGSDWAILVKLTE